MFWVFTEKSDFQGGGSSQKTDIEGGQPNKEGGSGVDQFADSRGLRGAWQERGGWCF